MQESNNFNRSKVEKSLDILNSSVAFGRAIPSALHTNLFALTDDDRIKI